MKFSVLIIFEAHDSLPTDHIHFSSLFIEYRLSHKIAVVRFFVMHRKQSKESRPFLRKRRKWRGTALFLHLIFIGHVAKAV